MDTPTLLILGGIALVVVVAAVLFALNRSWGNFPERAGTLPTTDPVARGGIDALAAALPDEPLIERSDQFAGPASAPASPPSRVPITHPMVRRAAENALQQGGRAAQYIVREGDQLYFAFDQISDPAQRQAAYDVMRRFEAGEEVDLPAIMALVRQIFQG